MSEYAKFSVPVPPSEDANLSPAEKAAQSAQLRSPGVVTHDSASGRTEILDTQTTRLPGPKPGDLVTRNGKQCVVLADLDIMEVEAARKANLYPTNPESPAGAKSQESQQENKPADDQQQNEQQPVRWESPLVDQITSVYAPELGESGMQALVARAVTLGEADLPDHVAADFAQRIETATPQNLKVAYNEAYTEAVKHANAMVEAVGVRDLDSFYKHAETKQRGEFMEARYKFAEGDGRALQQMARQYLAQHPDASVDPDAVDMMMAEGNDVHGGKLSRKNGVAYVTFAENGETTTLAAAIRARRVKVSNNG